MTPPADGDSNGKLPLFRPEVARRRANAWLGEISLARPFKTRWLLAGTAAFVVAVLAFLALSSHTERVRVRGELVPTAGIAELASPFDGIVSAVFVAEGATVAAGEPVAKVVAPRHTRDGNAQLALERLVDERRKELQSAIDAAAQRHQLQLQAQAGQRSWLEEERAALGATRDTADRRVDLAERMLRRIEKLHADGSVSTLEFNRYEVELLEAKSVADGVRRQQSALGRQVDALGQQGLELTRLYASELASLRGQLSSLEREAAERRARTEDVLVAPFVGRISLQALRPGQRVRTGDPLASVVPEGAELQAEFLVPARLVGRLRSGDPAELGHDAFPYQLYGLQHGVVSAVAESPVPGSSPPQFRVAVTLDRQYLERDGRRYSLRPGMTLEADIALEADSLLGRVFAPLRTLAREAP